MRNKNHQWERGMWPTNVMHISEVSWCMGTVRTVSSPKRWTLKVEWEMWVEFVCYMIFQALSRYVFPPRMFQFEATISRLSPLDAANPLEIMMVTPQWTRTALAVSFALGCPKGQSPRPCHCMVSPSRPIAKFSHNLNILVDVWWWC